MRVESIYPFRLGDRVSSNWAKTPGIYAIRHKDSSKVYVGSTGGIIVTRIRSHRSLLRAGKHTNPHLQNAYQKHGENAFEWLVLQEMESPSQSDLWIAEDDWCKKLDAYNWAKGYNSRIDPSTCKGMKHAPAELLKSIRNQPTPSLRKRYFGPYFLISPEGENIFVEKNLKEFCMSKGLPQATMNSCLNRKTVSCKGWSFANRREKMRHGPRDENCRSYSFVGPDGSIHEGRNVQAFARSVGASHQGFHLVLSGKSKSCKGFTLNKMRDEG